MLCSQLLFIKCFFYFKIQECSVFLSTESQFCLGYSFSCINRRGNGLFEAFAVGLWVADPCPHPTPSGHALRLQAPEPAWLSFQQTENVQGEMPMTGWWLSFTFPCNDETHLDFCQILGTVFLYSIEFFFLITAICICSVCHFPRYF